jgi:predicted CoA-substrate-specific enzyme activase
LSKGKLLAGLDAGHVQTKAVIMRAHEILGYCTVPTGFEVAAAAQTALNRALENVGASRGELAGIAATGIFRDRISAPPLNVNRAVPEYVADAKGALFLNKNSRTVIDVAGNVQKAIRYDPEGNLVDVIQNDKCAEGLGIFYTTMAKAIGLSEGEMSEIALQSTRNVSVGIQCVVSAESEAIDLMCQGADTADVANAVVRFIVERVAAMCASISLAKEIVIAGGLAKSKPLIQHLANVIKEDVTVLDFAEYVGAIGAVVSYEGGK